MPRGKKICPACSTECGIRTVTCKCNHTFSFSAKKGNGDKKKKTEYISPATQELLEHVALNPYVEPEKMNSDDHANRILSYGKDRALNLLRQSKNSTWSHVNWKKVEEKLN
jgi:hypothetical protein